MAAVRVNQRAWRASSPLEDRSSQSRRRRERFYNSRNFQSACYLHRAQHFSHCRSKTNWGQHKRAWYQRWTRRVFAARHRARRHPAHVVPAIHGRRILRRSWLLLVVMMCRDVAKAPHATVHAIHQQGSAGQRRVQKHYRQQAKPPGRDPKAFLFWAAHGN
jgi:hypothetical protein